jgi:hypothetical protein
LKLAADQAGMRKIYTTGDARDTNVRLAPRLLTAFCKSRYALEKFFGHARWSTEPAVSAQAAIDIGCCVSRRQST